MIAIKNRLIAQPIVVMIIFVFTNIWSQECVSEVHIKTNAHNSIIEINENVLIASDTTLSLNRGVYQLKIKESKVKWGSRTILDTMNIVNCDEQFFREYHFDSERMITSNPTDADVYLNGIFMGRTPLIYSGNNETLLLSKKYFESKSIRSSDVSGKMVVSLKQIEFNSETEFSETILFKVLFGSAVILGSTAAYLKIEADRNYDKYLETQDKKYLNTVNSLDLYSGIAFGALQINFGVLIYKFIFE
ncbi:MAG: PEGA domain-containing protein [Bacteroidetes bacterium]|nr:PEGA domain-containing protein [Bacteroidota bacterium]MBU1680080.1 PEGA domain-containing protein [Bacteroidota bacterium]MBU2507905.1 PEGA domain-containing protein [Bacteroidota bacterium]